MKPRNVRHFAVFLASAVLLAAAADGLGDESPVRPDVSGASHASEPVVAQDNDAAITTVPLRKGEDPSRSPDNTVGQDNIAAQENADAQDNTVAVSQAPQQTRRKARRRPPSA